MEKSLPEENWDLEISYEAQENSCESNGKRENDSLIQTSRSKKSNKRSSDRFNDIRQKLRKVSVKDLEKLCEQIAALNERIMNAREITYLRYELPVEMKNKLEMEAQELESLYAEMRDATKNLEIIRAQRAALGTERKWMESQISKLKADAVAEMEMIVSVYDSGMMDRWEDVKQSNSASAVENFLHDVKGKMEAMKNLQMLGTNKLAALRDQEKKNRVVSKKEKKRMNKDKREVGSFCSTQSVSSLTIPSQTTFDTESDDLLEESTVLDSIVFNLMYDHVLNLNWTPTALDID